VRDGAMVCERTVHLVQHIYLFGPNPRPNCYCTVHCTSFNRDIVGTRNEDYAPGGSLTSHSAEWTQAEREACRLA
jgi:hypothetical protein